MDWSKVWDVAKKALRAGGSAAVGLLVSGLTKDPKYGIVAGVAYGLIGKLLRDKFPAQFGWLPVL